MTELNVTLHWHGPLRVGAMPKNEKEIKKAGLHCPGIYIYFQKYPCVAGVYAGKTNVLAGRIREHLAGFLAFGYYLRVDDPDLTSSTKNKKIATTLEDHDSGNTYYKYTHPEWHGLGCYNNLDKAIEHSKREVERLSFFYCPYLEDCDPITDLQGLRGMELDGKINHKELIARLEASLINDLKTAKDKSQTHTWVCDNGRKEPMGNDHINTITHIVDDKNFDNTINLINYLQGK